MDRLLVQDKKIPNWSNYCTVGAGLDIKIVSHDCAGYIAAWRLVVGKDDYTGKDFNSLYDTLKSLVEIYDLKQISKAKKDVLVVYIDNIYKVDGFFSKHITERFPEELDEKPIYLQLFDFIEIREMKAWQKDLHRADEIATYAQHMINDLFMPNSYFYLTPNQIPRKYLQKAVKDTKNTLAADIYPETYNDWLYMRQAYFGGLCYAIPYDGIHEEPMLAIDLTSAYIYAFLLEKHVISTATEEDPKNWEYFLYSSSKSSIGEYEISFSAWSSKISCWEDEDGHKLYPGQQKATFIFNDIDLKLFLQVADVHEVKCLFLESYTLGDISAPVREVLVREYCKKNAIKPHKDESEDMHRQYIFQKAIINGVYGDTCRKIYSTKAFKDYKKGTIVSPPQWGIWITSYCKKYILETASKLDGWYYSDTDSIYCKDTPENRAIIESYNKKVQAKVKAFCDKYNYDYELLKDLGTFDIEAEIVKMKVIKQKQYMYTTKEGKMVLKAAGCDKRSITLDDSLYSLDKIPAGKRVHGFICEEPSDLVINGKVVAHSDSSYFEITTIDDEQDDLIRLCIELGLEEK